MKIKQVLVLSLFIAFFVTSKAQDATDTTATIKVSGSCGMCKQRIEKAAKIKGVTKAIWNVATQQLQIFFNPAITGLSAIQTNIAAAGHDTELKKAKEEDYNNLPECCLYRKEATGIQTENELFHATDNVVSGIVLTEDKKGRYLALEGASIIWLESGKGVTTDKHGSFAISKDSAVKKLVISYAGYQPDTLLINEIKDIQIILGANHVLTTVKVTSRTRSTYVNTLSAIRTTHITSKELLKAACCNLSESFETNPSVDVAYNDAVTGSKQIQLLGLSGNYTQLTVENLPGPRGLATPLGLNSIAGPWVESIQLSKGTGSVVNGFESIAGQINVELKKPENSEKLYINGYVNSMGKTDLNVNLATRINEKWSTALLLHDDFLYNRSDFNSDGFRDLPTGNLFAAINRWKFDNGQGVMAQFGVKILTDNKTGGQLDYEPSKQFSSSLYGLGIKTNRYETFGKIGYVFPQKKYQSIGLQMAAFKHEQDAYFGSTIYNAAQTNYYANLIYQSIISTTDHKFRTGLSFSSDKYDETYSRYYFKRTETVPGAFFEYTFNQSEKFNVVAGLRADHNNLFGWMVTPRLNIRYEPIKGTTIRLSAGRGQRTANILAENLGVLASSRMLVFPEITNNAYGLHPEVAWNKGISIDQKFKLLNHEAMISFDFFRNDFSNQVVADLEDARLLQLYDLSGKSFSNSLQTEISFIPVNKLDVRLAYRWFDVRTTYGNRLLQKPLIAAHRAFANFAYELTQWKFDCTINFVGSKRIPSTLSNPADRQLPAVSTPYTTINAQVSKTFGRAKKFDLYAGVENLGNFFQQNAIISANQPFSPYFDASLIWGPVIGRMFYGGFRYQIK